VNSGSQPKIDVSSSQQYDVCIIGSGPAGTTAALRLAEKGHKVLVLESGTDEPDDNIQTLNQIHSTGKAFREGFINRLRMLGGTSNLWPGRCMPLEPIDFKFRDWVSTTAWPISYDEYVSSLEKATSLLGISAIEAKKYCRQQQVSTPALESTKFSIKLALWGKSPKRFKSEYSEKRRQLNNLTIKTGFTVVAYQFDESGKSLTAVTARNMAQQELTVTAKTFIIACGGIENARTLLIAKQQNPHAKFSTDHVGRYFMDHPRAVKGRITLNEGVNWADFLGHPINGGIRQLGIGLSDEQQIQHRLLNSYICVEPETNELIAKGYDSTIQSLKRVLKKGHTGSRLDFKNMSSVSDLVYQLTPKEILPNWLYRIYCWLRSFVKEHKRELVIINQCEQVADPESRITLSDDIDFFGNPKAVVHWKMNDLDVETIQSLHLELGKWLHTENLGTLTTDATSIKASDFDDASHHIGTTRMSQDAKDGVVDRNLKVHGLDNLYMAGSSTFVTSGSGNPTWSIVAFALRLAEHLDIKFKKA
jgi:hypothetical protein